jgi:hypothetical protein
LVRILPIGMSLVIACAGRSSDAEDAGMSATSAPNGTEGGETSRGGSESHGGDAGDTEGSCEPLTLEVPDEPIVAVVLENHGADTIYVDGARGLEQPWCLGIILPFLVERIDTGEIMRPEEGWCTSVCSKLADWYFCDGGACPPECPSHPGPIRIEPGGTYTIAWTAVVYRNVELPEHCVGCDEPITLGCQVPEPLDAGTEYAFRAWAGSAPDCSECDCEPDAEGSCVLDAVDAGVVGPLASATATTTGKPDTLSIVFD